MPDRIVRDELLESERWINLPNDTDRLSYVGLLLTCDDYGNFEGGLRRMFRFFHAFTQVKTDEATATMLGHLHDADMIRPYKNPDNKDDKHEYWHVMRFETTKYYLVRKWPRSPWDVARTEGRNQTHQRRTAVMDQAPPENLFQPLVNVFHAVGGAVGGAADSVMPASVPDSISRSTHTLDANSSKNSPTNSPNDVTSLETKSKRINGARRATYLDPAWRLPDDWRDWACKAYHIDPQKAVRISLTFRDYWLAKSGANATKRDWYATWRNWVRKDCGDD